MTTDIRRIAEILPECARRRLYQNRDGVHIQCGPKSNEGVDAKAIIADADYFKVKSVAVEDCYNCLGLSIPDEIPSLALSPPPKEPPNIRRFRIETDGSIVYTRKEDEWEPPRDINGYERDANNPWRFVSLWPECAKRKPAPKRTKICGSFDVDMQCNNPKSILCGMKVTHKQCQQCEVRES